MPTDGYPRIRRSLARFGLGMLQISARTHDRRKLAVREAVVTKLMDDAQVEVLRALKEGRITLDQLVDLDRQRKLSGSEILATLTQQQPLWATFAATLPRLGRAEASRKRYRTTIAQMKRTLNRDAMTVGDLLGLDWATLERQWPNGASDWNHVRRLVSRCLTLWVGLHHPLRIATLAQIAPRKESYRVPDLTIAEFYRILGFVREDLRPVYRVLVGTGLRVRTEYLRMDATHILPYTRQLRVPDEGKTGFRMVRVDDVTWPYVAAAIPAPKQYKCLYQHWKAAARTAGHPHLTLHDLRHCMGRWALEAGAPQRDVQTQFGHTSPAMTAKYVASLTQTSVSAALGKALAQETR